MAKEAWSLTMRTHAWADASLLRLIAASLQTPHCLSKTLSVSCVIYILFFSYSFFLSRIAPAAPALQTLRMLWAINGPTCVDHARLSFWKNAENGCWGVMFTYILVRVSVYIYLGTNNKVCSLSYALVVCEQLANNPKMQATLLAAQDDLFFFLVYLPKSYKEK
jgi:hypothetical protein